MLLSIARRRSARGKSRAALLAIDKALDKLGRKSSSLFKVSPDNFSQIKRALLLKGYSHKDLSEYAPARRAFLSAYELGEVDAGALDFLTSELLEAKDLSLRARSIYLDYLSLVSHSESPEQARKNLKLLGELSSPDWLRPENIRLIEEWNEEIALRRGDLPWPHRHLGAIALFFNDWWQAIQSLQRACALGGADYGTVQKLAYALFRVGQFQEAKEHLDRLIKCRPSDGAFLLRAHVLREQRDYAGAALDYRRVSESNLLTDEERLSYAEVCINAGYFKEAARQVNILSSYDDPRWLLMSAMVDHSEKRDSEALMKFRRVMPLEEFGSQAITQTLSLLAENPYAEGALEALGDIPEYYRDDLYWTVKGNVLLGLGCVGQALYAWYQVLYPGDGLRNTITSAGQSYFLGLYNAGQDLEIISAVRTGLAAEIASGEAVDIIVSALSRYILKNLHHTHRAKKFLKDIDLVSAYSPAHPMQQRLDLLRGLLHVSLFNYLKAADIFSSLPTAFLEKEELAFQVARCALHIGDNSACLEALEHLRSEAQRTIRLRSALAALNGDWDEAAQYLSELQPSNNHNEFSAAIFFQAGRWTDLERLKDVAGDVVSYYQIARLLRSGEYKSALQVLSLIPTDEPRRALAEHLFGWYHLQAARDYKAAGNSARTIKSLTDALILWPSSDGPAAHLKRLDADLMGELLDRGDRESVGSILEACAARRGPGDPASCHNLALFHLVSGVLKAERDDFEEAIQSWEKSIAYLCVTLSNQTYMAEWIDRRLEGYGINQTVETAAYIERDLLQYYEATFKKWSEQLSNRAMPAESAKLSDLSLALRAELQGARLVGKLGGFSVPPHTPYKIAAGPIYISMMGWERPFALFLSQIKIIDMSLPESLDDDPMRALLDLMAKLEAEEREGAVDVSVKEQAEKLFSILRFAAADEEAGNLEAALRRLRGAKAAYKPVRAGRSLRKREFQKAQSSGSLSLRSPAFARCRSTKRFRELAAKYEIELLIALGEQDIASADDRISSGMEHWREAVALAVDSKHHLQVIGKIRETAMGRAYVLEDKGQYDEAIRLLESVGEWCADDDLYSLCSRLYAVRGVLAGNRDEWELAVANLREAAYLNPHSLYAQWNLANSLVFLTDEIRSQDRVRARILLEEAMDAVYVCRYIDVNNEKYGELEILIRANLNMLRIEAGEISMEELSPEDLLDLLQMYR
jgi:tetratricopeptide (TPR) repeat protein